MSSASQPAVDSDSDSPPNRHWSPDADPVSSKNYALSGKIMLASIIVLFVVVIFLVLLHLYARWYLRRHHLRRNETRRRSRRNRPTRVVFYVDSNIGPNVHTGGLDASLLKSLPVFVYSSETDGKMSECAVCLSEFEEGQKGRVLPKCKHSFHTECIDMWFHSNSTCPLCRSPVEPSEPETAIVVEQPESVAEPGSGASLSSPVSQDREHTGTTSLADRRKGIDVRIDVPSRNDIVAENDFRLPSPSQGFRSPGSRFLALKRIISMSMKSPSSDVGPSCLPAATESDLESARQESTRTGTDTCVR